MTLLRLNDVFYSRAWIKDIDDGGGPVIYSLFDAEAAPASSSSSSSSSVVPGSPERLVGVKTSEDSPPVRAPTIPATPTEAERLRHMLTHLPFRSWCCRGRPARRWSCRSNRADG